MQFLRFLLFSCVLFFSNLQGMAGMREYFGGSTTTPKFNPNPAVTKSDFSYGTTKPNIKTNQNPFHIKIPINSTYHPRNNQAAIKQNDLSYSTKTSDIKLKQEKIHTKIATDTTSSAHYASNNQAAMMALTAPRYTTDTTNSLSSQLLANPSIKNYIEEEKALRKRYCSFKSDAQLKLEEAEQEKIKRGKFLQEERIQIRAERKNQKRLVDQFEELKKTATTKIRTEFVQPIQWGDYLPTTQSIFEYIGWREKAGVLKEKEDEEVEHQARMISCAQIQAIFAAMVIKDDDHKKSLQFLIANSFGCDETSDKNDNKLDKNVNTMFKKSSQGSGSGNGGGGGNKDPQKSGAGHDDIDTSGCLYVGDIIHDSRRCAKYIYLDDNHHYVTGYTLIPYDNKNIPGVYFSHYAEPVVWDPSNLKTFDGHASQYTIQPFDEKHAQLIKQRKHQEDVSKHAAYAQTSRENDTIARTQNAVKTIYDLGFRKTDQLTIQDKQLIKQGLENSGFYCNDADNIQVFFKNKNIIYSFLDGEGKSKSIGVQPNGCIYHVDNPKYKISQPQKPFQYVVINQNDQPTITPTKTTTKQPAQKTQNNTSPQQANSVNSKTQTPSVNPTPQVTGVTSPTTSTPSNPHIPAVVSPDRTQTTQPTISTPCQSDTPAVNTNTGSNNLSENKTKEPTNSPGDVTPPTNPTSNIPAHIIQALASQATNNNKKPAEHKNPSLDPHGTKNKPALGHEKTEESQAQKRRKQLIGAQESWLEKTDLSKANQEEKNMIQCMLDAMVDAKNDTDIEFAQAGLLAWEKAQQAESDEEYTYHIKKSKDYYKVVQRKTPLQSIAQQAQPIKPCDLDKLLNNYKTELVQYHQEEKSFNRQPSNNPFIDRIEKRAQALAESQEQLQSKNLPHRTYEMSPQARGFMMAHNMNYAAFDGGKVTNYQHCLTQEILGIIESSAGAALKYDSKSMIGQLAQYNCDLAVSAQQLNQLAHVEQATALTDVSHFFQTYGRAMIDYELETEAWCGMVQGSYDGTVQALTKWNNFLIKLGHNRNQTLKEVAHDCKSLGTSLLKIGAEIGEFTPFAYYEDVLKDMIDDFRNQSRLDDDASHQSRVDLRNERNLRSLQNALQTAEVVVAEMMKKSVRENVAGVTEIAVDGIITGKVTDALLHLSAIVGNEALQLAQQIKKNVPSHLQDATPRFATNAGDLSIIAEGTGENIGSAIAAQRIANNIEQIAKNADRVKSLNEKINEITKIDPKEAATFQKSIEPYLNSEKIINVERLRSIEGIDQINKYKEFTNNFHPDGIAKLKLEEILHLNLCDWLEPQARKINEQLKLSGGLKIIDPVSKAEVLIEEFDLFHSLLGEIKPGSIRNTTKGGHLPILELKTALFEIGEIKSFGNGFFDMNITCGSNSKINSFFPAGTTIEQAVEIIENAIQQTVNNPSLIKNFEIIQRSSGTCTTLEIQGQFNQIFKFNIENKKIKFFPLSPFTQKIL